MTIPKNNPMESLRGLIASIFFPTAAPSRIDYPANDCQNKSCEQDGSDGRNFCVRHNENGRKRGNKNSGSQTSESSHFRLAVAAFGFAGA